MQTLMFTEFIVMILPGFHGFLCEITSVQVGWQWVRGRACERPLVSDWLLGYMKEETSRIIHNFSDCLNTQTYI